MTAEKSGELTKEGIESLAKSRPIIWVNRGDRLISPQQGNKDSKD